jgi:acyl-homoserine-lactone acylase
MRKSAAATSLAISLKPEASSIMITLRLQTLLLACVLLTRAASPNAAASQAVVTVTEHGVPHIVAPDYRALGFGYGYVMAENDLCGMASMFATYSGERAMRYGADGVDLNYLLGRRPVNNVASDLVMRLMIDDAHIKAAQRTSPRQIDALLRGYAEGFNEYLDSEQARAKACPARGSPRPIQPADIQRRMQGLAMLLSSGLLRQEIFDATPPTSDSGERTASTVQPIDVGSAGSNAYAFGKSLTDNDRGLLLANPHFLWDGPERFVELHLTVPGEYDAMGAALQGVPLVMIGFNRSLAWTHTVATDKRGVLYRLTLDPKDPTRYLLDGRSIPMQRQRVTTHSLDAAGKLVEHGHDFWLTRFGPVVMSRSMPWSREHAYALLDANRDNDRLLQQWLAIGRSRNTPELKSKLQRTLGLPWVNTLATDSEGNAFYADFSVAPDLSDATLGTCAIPTVTGFESLLAVLDGSRSNCFPDNKRATPQRGVLSAAARPSMLRTDFVANSNDSHWLTHPDAPLEGFPAIIGAERSVRKLRTRQSLLQLQPWTVAADSNTAPRISMQAVQNLLFSSDSLQADLVLPKLMPACTPAAAKIADAIERRRIERGCQALSGWDRRYDLESTGAHLFNEFVNRLKQPGGEDLGAVASLWNVPFDAQDPLHTPRDLAVEHPSVWKAMSDAVARLDQAGLPLDAKLGTVQFVIRNGTRIPLHGGPTFNSMHATLVPGVGYTDPIAPSNAYTLIVSFDASGPRAEAILASSQSPEPDSPYYADQTIAYSLKQWAQLPFTAAAVAAAAIGPPRVLRLPQR